MARKFGAPAQKSGLRDPQKGRRRSAVAGDGRLDLGEQARLRPLANVGVVAPRLDEVFQQPGHLGPAWGPHGEARRAACGRGPALAGGWAGRSSPRASHFPRGTRLPRPAATAVAISLERAWRSFTTGSPAEG